MQQELVAAQARLELRLPLQERVGPEELQERRPEQQAELVCGLRVHGPERRRLLRQPGRSAQHWQWLAEVQRRLAASRRLARAMQLEQASLRGLVDAAGERCGAELRESQAWALEAVQPLLPAERVLRQGAQRRPVLGAMEQR